MVSSWDSSTAWFGGPPPVGEWARAGARGSDLRDAHVKEFAAIFDRSPAVGAPAGSTIRAIRYQDAVSTGIEPNLADPAVGVLRQRDHVRRVHAGGAGALSHAVGREGQDGRAGVIGEDAGVPRCLA
jgi:hypothetical protein